MAISRGYTSSKDLRLHVKLTYAPQNASPVFARAAGALPREDGSRLRGAAARAATQAAEVGRRMAVADLEEVAARAAGWATAAYAARGYDIPVKPVGLGAGWKLVVDGDARAQKWARILEVGYGPQDTHDFIRQSRKKRAVKITAHNFKPGFYLIIPKVHGKVSQGEGGKLTFAPARDSRLGGRVNPEDLRQFEARPVEADLVQTFDAEAGEETYADPRRRFVPGIDRGKRYTHDYGDGGQWEYGEAIGGGPETTYNTGGYDPLGRTALGHDARGRTRTETRGVREQERGNPAWVVDRMAQNIRRAGVLVNEPRPGKPGRTTERFSRRNGDGELIPGMANRKGSRAAATLNTRLEGGRVVRTGVNNLRLTALNASYGLPEDNSDEQRVVSRRGDVLSFVTLSTRVPLRPRPGRQGHHILQRAGQKMEARIRALIQAAEAERQAGFNREAYLETLRSALGRAL